MKEKLRSAAADLDPLRLLDEIRTMQRHLADLAAGEVPSLIAGRDPELDSFLKSLKTAWQHGEVRATHATNPKPPRDWRTRVDPFEIAWPLVRQGREAEADRRSLRQRSETVH
jgi:hypothetical protein